MGWICDTMVCVFEMGKGRYGRCECVHDFEDIYG